MMRIAWVIAGAVPLSLLVQGALGDDLSQRLRHDPFAAKPLSARVGPSGGSGGPSLPSDHPPLRAVLAAGTDSRVLFGSQLLRIGETSGEYRLVQVRERSAIFDLAGQKVEIGLKSTLLP